MLTIKPVSAGHEGEGLGLLCAVREQACEGGLQCLKEVGCAIEKMASMAQILKATAKLFLVNY